VVETAQYSTPVGFFVGATLLYSFPDAGTFKTRKKTMPKTQTLERDKESEQREIAVRNAFIGDQVMSLLGAPSDLHCIQVRRLWDNRYRVNIFTGPDVVSAKVANSYFLLVDGEGKIVSSNPNISRQNAGQPEAALPLRS
jgi:hypothetical protein